MRDAFTHILDTYTGTHTQTNDCSCIWYLFTKIRLSAVAFIRWVSRWRRGYDSHPTHIPGEKLHTTITRGSSRGAESINRVLTVLRAQSVSAGALIIPSRPKRTVYFLSHASGVGKSTSPTCIQGIFHTLHELPFSNAWHRVRNDSTYIFMERMKNCRGAWRSSCFSAHKTTIAIDIYSLPDPFLVPK